MKQITAQDGRTYRRASRWIRVHLDYVTERHSLADYASDGLLAWFRHDGRMYALGQFISLSYPIFFENEDEKTSFLSAYDATTWYRPFLMEMDDSGEYVRLFEEIEGGTES